MERSFRESLIRFQNRSEEAFKERKSIFNGLNYLAALAVFILSTLFASLSLPIRLLSRSFRRGQDSKVIVAKASNTKKLIQSNRKVILNFSAHWCGPCLLMENTLEEFAKEYREVKIAKINVDADPDLAKEFIIRGVPQFVLMVDGEETKRHAGPMTGQELHQFSSV